MLAVLQKVSLLINKSVLENPEKEPLTRTGQLAKLISDVAPKNFKEKKHPATRSFQAIRIYINSELEEIDFALKGAMNILAPEGRIW